MDTTPPLSSTAEAKAQPAKRFVAGRSLRWGSIFTPFYRLEVECPECYKVHQLVLYRDEMTFLADLAGVAPLNARLVTLESDRPLVRCGVCVVRHGGEQP